MHHAKPSIFVLILLACYEASIFEQSRIVFQTVNIRLACVNYVTGYVSCCISACVETRCAAVAFGVL